MQVLQTTLLTGPYEWDPDLLPRSEFEARLARVRAVLAKEGASALVVHGHPGDYGALNYLTGFVPKLGPALAVMSRDGAVSVLTQGTDLMLPWAKRLTWVDDVRTLANIAALLGVWLRERGLERDVLLGTWGGDAMPQVLHAGIERAVAPIGRVAALDAPLDALRRRKSALELRLMRRACEMLDTAAAALVASAQGGAGNRSAALAAERAAYAGGAQDVRVAVSLGAGGPPLPLDSARDDKVDPLLAAIVVQHAGYWAEGAVTATGRPGPAAARAEAALAAVLQAARAGTTAAALYRTAVAALAPCAPHPLMRGSIGYGIGLSLEETPLRTEIASDRLEADGVYALRVGAQGAVGDAAAASAMLAVSDAGTEILWRTPWRNGR